MGRGTSVDVVLAVGELAVDLLGAAVLEAVEVAKTQPLICIAQTAVGKFDMTEDVTLLFSW